MDAMMSKEDVLKIIGPIFGKICCRKQVGLIKSLTLGFGEKVYLEPTKLRERLRDPYRGEWEIGTWNLCAWRVGRENEIICGSNDSSDVKELDRSIGQIEFGNLVELQELNKFDIRAVFDNGIYVDFLATIKASSEHDTFHVFCPNKIFVAYYAGKGWTAKKSNEGQLNKKIN